MRGRVQGVFFRDSLQQRVREIGGIAGWVRNRSDGSVEAVFEGPRAAIERIVDWCRTGPPRARVDDVEVTWEDPDGLAGFRVS